MPAQGNRTDVALMLEDIREGMTDREMVEKYGSYSDWCRKYLMLIYSLVDYMDRYLGAWNTYGRMLKEYRNDCYPARDWTTQTHVYHGETGMGKSRRAFYEAKKGPKMAVVTVGKKGQKFWADKCEGATDMIIEDYSGEIPFRKLLQLLDRYPMNVEVKGSNVNWAPKRVFITSNLHPSQWYADMEWDRKNPLYRRLREYGSITKFSTAWLPPVVVVQGDDTQDVSQYLDDVNNAMDMDEEILEMGRHLVGGGLDEIVECDCKPGKSCGMCFPGK